MNVTLLKALLALVPTGLLFSGSVVLISRGKTVWSFLQLIGAACLEVISKPWSGLIPGPEPRVLRGSRERHRGPRQVLKWLLVIVALTHLFEALDMFPWMHWGVEDSLGHYLDLSSAVLGLALFPTGYLLHTLATQHA